MDLSLPFERPYRVRFDEAGADGRVRASSLVRYVQDLAWQHSEAAGFDRAWYAARGLAWLVRGLELELMGSATYGATLRISTRVTGWRRMWARRSSAIIDPGGSTLARAAIDWVLLDASGRPVRVPRELEAFAPDASAFRPLRAEVGAAPPEATLVVATVRASDLDPMGHLNNAAYVDLLEAAAIDAGRPFDPPLTVRLEYLVPAFAGMAVSSLAWRCGTGLSYRLVGPDGTTDLLRATLT